MASHAYRHHHNHSDPPWLHHLTPQDQEQRYWTFTLVALAAALIVLGTSILWALL